MRIATVLILLVPLGCRTTPHTARTPRDARVATMDSATARRICESPDSVIAGTKDCVLLDQSRRASEKLRPPPRAP